MTHKLIKFPDYNYLISSNRFDLMAKYLYIKHYNVRNKVLFFTELYKNHIITFNNCWEYPGTKTSIEDFIESFDKIIESIKSSGFIEEYAIPIGLNNTIINGAHRLMTSYFYKKNIHIKIENKTACSLYNYDFFLNRKDFQSLDIVYSDSMALEYIKINKNTRIMVVHPISYDSNKIMKIMNIIKQFGYIYYTKNINLTKKGYNNLIKEMYRGETWIGGLFPKGVSTKTDLCYSKNPTICIIIDMIDTNNLVLMKNKCRDLFNIGKHSLHISDFTNDTFRIASSLLNQNSIYFLNNGNNDITNKTKRTLTCYFNKLKDNNEDYCLTSSLIMEMFSLRNAKDVDYLSNKNISINIENIGLHDGKWENYYHINKDDIIYNPQNHFYLNGFKFATLNIVKKMKENRAEEKDIRDIALISTLV